MMTSILAWLGLSSLGGWLIGGAYHFSGAGAEPPEHEDAPHPFVHFAMAIAGLAILLYIVKMALGRMK